GNDTKSFYLPEIGVSRHLSERLAWGIALYGNGGLDTDYKFNPYARFGAQGPAGVALKQAFLTPALAFKVNDANSIGLGINVAYRRFSAKGIGLFSSFSASPDNVSDRGAAHSTGVGAWLGWLGK